MEYPFEAYFVHISKDGKIAVIGVMFKEGKENKILSKIWSKFPLKKGEIRAEDINNLLPKNREYYKFMGSLTTPTCTEEVIWIVFKISVEMSKKQVKAFFDLYSHPNDRLIHPTNNREIIYYKN